MKIILNSDKEFVAKIRKRIEENDGYCPCVLVKSADTLCMCKEFREQKEAGPCHCGLYIKVEDIKEA